MDEYILFADETGKAPHNPYFCFAGYAIKRSEYVDYLIPAINSLKEKTFGKTSVVFHYTEMKGNKNDFSVFIDSTIRNRFWGEFVGIFSKLNIVVLGVYYDENIMRACFGKGGTTSYDIAFRHLLENYVHFLRSVKGIGAICIESRTSKENMFLQTNYFDYINNGSIYYTPNDTKYHLASIGFIIKEDNCVGLQVADILPSRLMRIVNGQKDYYGMDAVINGKIYQAGTDYMPILGLKKII